MTDFDPTDWRRLLTAAERSRMLDDIARVSLTAGTALFPGQPWQDLDVAAHSLAVHKSPVERLGFIEQALPVLTQAARQIGQSPATTSIAQTRMVTPAILARRVGTRALLSAARRGQAAHGLEESVTVLTPDTPENRAAKSFLRLLERDSAAIRRMAEAEEETEASGRAERCAAQFHGLLADAWWKGVTGDNLAWTKPPSQRAMARPEYAQIFRTMRRYRADFAFDWSLPLFALPPRETWRLYETWCLFTVLDALRNRGWLPAADVDAATPALFAVWESRLTFTSAQGNASRVRLVGPQGRRLSLTYNQTFAQGERSLSHTMQPDITVEDEIQGRLWILDAKFKPYTLPGEEGEDVNQMHAYRDAVVGVDGRRCVAHAWCLYAGQVDAPNRASITYGGGENAPVGALCLRPGDTASFRNLGDLLTSWLAQSARPAFPEN